MVFVRCRRVKPCVQSFAQWRRWKNLDSEMNKVKTLLTYHMKFRGTLKECNTFTSQPLDIPSPCTWTSFPITDSGCPLLDALLVRFGGHSEIPFRWPDEGLRSQQGLGNGRGRPPKTSHGNRSEMNIYLYIFCPQSESDQTKTHLWRTSLEELCTVRGCCCYRMDEAGVRRREYGRKGVEV